MKWSLTWTLNYFFFSVLLFPSSFVVFCECNVTVWWQRQNYSCVWFKPILCWVIIQCQCLGLDLIKQLTCERFSHNSQFSYTVLGLRAVVIKPERWNILSLNVFETGGVAAEAGAYPSYNRAEAGYVLDGFYAIYCKKNVQFFYVLWVKTLHKLKYNTHGITGLRAVVG